MSNTKKTDEESPYATTAEEWRGGKPIGPEHDKSFHVEDYYDPTTGERVSTDWDTDAQKAMPKQEVSSTTEKAPKASK